MNLSKKESLTVYSALVSMFLLAGLVITVSFTKNEKRDYNPIPIITNNPARALNTAFQPNVNRATIGTYTVSFATTVNLANLTSSGIVYLEISPDNSTWTTINSAGVTRTLSVSLSVGIAETNLYNVQGVTPPGWYCRLRTTTTGIATVAFSSGQETMY